MGQPIAKVVTRPTPQRPPGMGAAGCEFVFGLGWTAFSLLFVIVPVVVLVTEWQNAILLRSTGVTTQAVVIDHRMIEDSDGDSYYVTYRYEVPIKGDRLRLTHEESVSQATYQELTLESRALVRYAAANPELVRLEGQSKTFEAILLTCFGLFGGAFVLLGLWLLYSNGRQFNQARLLAWSGKTAAGRVTDCWTETDSDGDREYCVAFRFAPPDQAEITSAESNRKAYNLLQVGDPVQVRYVPRQPQICRLEV